MPASAKFNPFTAKDFIQKYCSFIPLKSKEEDKGTPSKRSIAGPMARNGIKAVALTAVFLSIYDLKKTLTFESRKNTIVSAAISCLEVCDCDLMNRPIGVEQVLIMS